MKSDRRTSKVNFNRVTHENMQSACQKTSSCKQENCGVPGWTRASNGAKATAAIETLLVDRGEVGGATPSDGKPKTFLAGG